MIFKKRVNGSWTDIPHYIHKTDTDILTTLPADIYANGTTATVGLKGNMSQSGTPTSTTPIQPSECGDKTNNLYDKDNADTYQAYMNDDLWTLTPSDSISIKILCDASTQYTLTIPSENSGSIFRIYESDDADVVPKNTNPPRLTRIIRSETTKSYTFTTSATAECIVFQGAYSARNVWLNGLMFNKGEYRSLEPYGQYKIPISSNSTTTPVYLGQVETTRKIKKYEFTGQEDWSISNNERVLYTALTDHLTSNELISYCSHYKSIANVSAMSALSNGECAFNNTLRWFYIKDDNYNDATSFKTYLQQQYAAGTPVCVWYLLANETTGIVNEPLRKIGDYADIVSGITIPTIAGANTLTVDTTLQPSEVSVNYKGWHPVQSVHERESGAWT